MSYVSKNTFTKIVSQFKKGQKLAADIIVEQNKAIQLAVDEMLIKCDKPKAEFLKGNARTNPAKAEVVDLFTSLHEGGFISSASAKAYATCFWIAFETGVPFSRDLHNQKSEAKKSEGKTSGKTKSGGIESTDRAALDKTICKALKQARLLGLLEFAAELVDLATDSLDGFTETTE